MLKTSTPGRDLIKGFEKLGPEYTRTKRIIAYLCPNKVPTIGWGHTKGVHHSDVGIREISMEQAEGFLDGDLHASEMYVTKLNPNLNANQFDALVSAAFNLGSFGESLSAAVRDGKFAAVPGLLKRYIHATHGEKPCDGRCGNKKCTGRIDEGLVTRRAAEAKLFTTKVTGDEA